MQNCQYDLGNSIFNSINMLRDQRGTPGLKLDDRLQIQAQNWANEITRKDVWEHNPNKAHADMVYKKTFYNFPIEIDGQDAFTWWAWGACDYRYYGREPPENKRGRYDYLAQILWYNTTKVGFGCAYRYINEFDTVLYVVAMYDPPGNVYCQYKYNVWPEKGSEIYKYLKEHPNRLEPKCIKRPLPNNTVPITKPKITRKPRI